MSRYMVNKLMWEVDTVAAALAEFKRDPGSFLAAWEARYERPVPPYPQGGRLTGAEREALRARDYRAIYAMGANPFLLWQFARSVSVPDEMGIEALISTFREAVAPFGHPDFHT